MEWIAVILALALGALAGWKFASRDTAAKNSRISELAAELDARKTVAENEKDMLTQSAAREIALLRENYEKSFAAEKENAAKEIAFIKEAHEKAMASLRENAEKEITLLKETHEKNMTSEKENTVKMMAEQEKALSLKLDLIKSEFKTLSDNIFTEKSQQLKEDNKNHLSTLLKPLQEKMVEFKQSVDATREKGIEQSTLLTDQLQKMMNEARRLGTEANALATALKGEQKTQGNWGEMILDDILTRSGLQAGIHYETQPTLKTEDGKTLKTEENKMLRPDVIVHYPDGREVIVDSKVSLTAYVDYMNAETETDRSSALERHLQSIRKHVDELAKKDYSHYLKKSGKEATDFVLMFIPNEPSYLLAMNKLPTLWVDAFNRKVLIVSPVNLIALLQLIHMAWVRADQDRNQENILKTAGQLLDRAYAFYEFFDEIGKNLERLTKSYGEAQNRLKGSHGIITSGRKLKELGVKLSKTKKIPARLQEFPLEEQPPLLAETVE